MGDSRLEHGRFSPRNSGVGGDALQSRVQRGNRGGRIGQQVEQAHQQVEQQAVGIDAADLVDVIGRLSAEERQAVLAALRRPR